MTSATLFQPTSNEAAKYHAILQRRIDEGAQRAAGVIQSIFTHTPKDQIANVRGVRFSPAATVAEGRPGVSVAVGDDSYTPSDYALSQIATKAGVPTMYLKDMASGSVWMRELAADLLTRHYTNGPADRMLVRSVNGQLRGWLSDRYRRLDSRPLVEALVSEAQAAGAVPIDGTATETRFALKVLLPEIIEPVPGEYMVRGVEWSNSDYGNGTHSVRLFGLRVVCLNGMTRENLLREVHLGGRLSDNITYSDRTYRLDTETSKSALRDVTRASLGAGSKEMFLDGIRKLNAKETTSTALKNATRNVGKETQKAIVDAFESSDVINLPAGNTAWRASNAISWVARHTEDAEKRLDLERLAGAVAA